MLFQVPYICVPSLSNTIKEEEMEKLKEKTEVRAKSKVLLKKEEGVEEYFDKFYELSMEAIEDALVF